MSGIELGPRYQPLRELGSGGMGRVFLVRDSVLGREVALKLLQVAPEEEEVRRFQREFALLAGIQHPGVARVHDFGYLRVPSSPAGQGETKPRPYFTSDYVPGHPLGADGAGPEVDAIWEVAAHLAEALAFLHRHQILHLDIKPGNIILPAGRRPLRPVLIDFGLFRRGLAPLPGEALRGSVPYLAPEYFQGGDLGPWTDVYALGVTLYHWATGAFPRPGPRLEGSGWVFDAGRDLVPPPLSRLRPDFPGALESILARCLALEPEARFPSGKELLEVLGRAGAHPGSVPVSSPASTVGRDEEIRAVERFLQGFRQPGLPFALLLTGPPGMGQSHLFREMKVRAQTAGLRFHLETGYSGRPCEPGALFRSLGEVLAGSEAARYRAFLARLGHSRRTVRNDTLEPERRLRRAEELAAAASSLREPLLIAADSLQFLDEISVELLIELVRFLSTATERPNIGVAVGFREEGPSAPLLRELTDLLLAPGRATVITLRPLDLSQALTLYRLRRGGEPETGALAMFQETGGAPARIVALTPGPAPSGPPGAESRPPLERAANLVREGGEQGREILCVLELLGRPAATAEIARVLELAAGRVARLLARLAAAGLVAETEGEGGRPGWVAAPAAARFTRPGRRSRLRTLERRLGEECLRGAEGDDDPRLLEAFRHFRAAGDRRRIRTLGLRVARSLRATYQNRASLEVYRQVLGALPPRPDARLEVALELADLHARVGGIDEGIAMLKELPIPGSRLPERLRRRLILKLGLLHARRGDFRLADSLFREGLDGSPRSNPPLARDEVLLFLNEQAAVKAFLGEDSEARRLCEKGLRTAGRSRGLRTRELALNLLATRANLALRQFEYPRAVRDYQLALEISEAIGSLGNQAIILNNLATAHSQCERYPEAIRAYREAERVCRRIDEGPSLASIRGNLAVLQARLGRWEEMEEILRDAGRLPPGSLGQRQEFVLAHARGLCRLYQGRYQEARPRFEEAIRLGRELGDRYVTAADEVYLIEVMIFEGCYAEASARLGAFLSGERPPALRRMALSRRAFLAGLLGREDLLDECAAAAAGLVVERPVPFLEAWDGLFLAWGLALCNRRQPAIEALEPAEGFFRRHGLLPAAALSRCVRAECLFLSGETGEARRLLEENFPAGNCLTEAIRPLLLARLLLDGGAGPAERRRAADLLAESGAALVGNALPEWNARRSALLSALRGDVPEETSDRDPAGARREGLRAPCRESFHFRLWVGGLPAASAPVATRGDNAPADPDARTAPLAVPGRLRERLAVRSAAMRRLAATLDRLRGKEVQVLIIGETGTGKELVARILHQESPRAGSAFVVINCAAIPPALLEAELFGARAGAFTGQTGDRQGILSRAAGGTVLIDEIAHATLEAQAKLLRVLSEKVLRPLGGEAEEAVDVRFLFATSRDLAREAREGRFREELLHRIQVVPVRVPPLRERIEDFPALAKMLLAEIDKEGASEASLPAGLEPAALRRLRSLPWPGNVRELRNVLQRALLENPDRITGQALERVLGETGTRSLFPPNLLVEKPLPALREQLERDYLLCHFRRLEGDTPALCRFLGLSSRQLYRRCVRLGVHLRRERGRL